MFLAVPPSYDLINHIITLGMDSAWRRRASLQCLSPNPQVFLDLCCGTGDMAINVSKLAVKGTMVLGTDYSHTMLEIAASKSASLEYEKSPDFILGDAARLPFSDSKFNCVGISFAFRNLTYKNSLAMVHLSEVFRILERGGSFVIVETSQPKNKLINKFFHIYLRLFVFWTGYLISRNKGAYRYLSESAAKFYTPEEVTKILLNAGFNRVDYKPLFFGAAGIYKAFKS